LDKVETVEAQRRCPLEKKTNNIFWKVFLTEIALIVLCVSMCAFMYVKSTKTAKAETKPLNLYVEMPNGEQVPWEKTKYSKIVISTKIKKQIIARATAEKKIIKHPKSNSITYSDSDLRQLVMDLAEEARFNNVRLLKKIIMCESGWKPTVVNWDSYDYGLWQINLYHNPDVSKQCALDATCSTRWAINEIQSGNIWKWKASRYCWGDSI
jgi:hypothetical protein